MPAGNTPRSFGWVTRLLHWVTALVVIAALPLGVWVSEMEVSLSTLGYFGIHKTLGITALALIALRILWHWHSPPPAPMAHSVMWQDRLARLVHRAFYVLLVAMPISGWAASSATGIDTVIFGRWALPRIAPVSEAWEKAGFAIHEALGMLLLAAVLLHLAGAFYRAVILRDGTLTRMIKG